MGEMEDGDDDTRKIAYIEYVPARLLDIEKEKRSVFFWRGFAVGWASLMAIAVVISHL